MPDLAVVNAGELVTCAGSGGDQERLAVIEEAAMLVNNGRVSWLGTMKDFKARAPGKAARTVDAAGGLVTPGFVDPHTHLAFAGTREDELERKAAGETYISILSTGGGIQRTVRETRKATGKQIVMESASRLSHLVANGVTTVEVKSGYGQRTRDELKMLRAIRALGRFTGARVVPTFLGLHARPPEFRDPGGYVDYAIREMLPAIASSGAAPRFSDCFCEEGVFTRDDCARYLRRSQELGFSLKIHADEFADAGGAGLSASLGCVSADHLGRSSRDGVLAMAKRGVVAVLLPGTSLYSAIPFADARAIIKAGCRVALGTDLSPNSWIESPQLVMGLACTALRMTPSQALLGFTAHAADALGLSGAGRLRVGSPADFVLHSVPSYRFLPYRLGGRYVRKVYKDGVEVGPRVS